MWRHQNPHNTAGKNIHSAATWEKSLAVPQTFNHRVHIILSDSYKIFRIETSIEIKIRLVVA